MGLTITIPKSTFNAYTVTGYKNGLLTNIIKQDEPTIPLPSTATTSGSAFRQAGKSTFDRLSDSSILADRAASGYFEQIENGQAVGWNFSSAPRRGRSTSCLND